MMRDEAEREDAVFRVLHIVGGLNVGGAETWLSKGLPTIDRTCYRFDFLVHGDGPQHYREQLESHGARVFTCPPPRKLLAYTRSFLRILRRNRYHAVHAHTYCSSGLALTVAAWAGVPTRIFHSHTAQDESHSRSPRALYFRFSRWLIQRYATRGVAVSEEAARAFFPANWQAQPQRWSVSPVGIDLAAFETKPDREAVRREFDIPINCKVIAHVGRFVPVKNHDLLLDIAAELSQLDASVVFLLIGDGPGRTAIERRVTSLGLASHFRFAGIRSDVPRLLSAGDAFLFPSRYEGFPLAYLESQAAGLPCVISDVIAPAADVVAGRTLRQSLANPPRVWAQALLQAFTMPRAANVSPQLRGVSIESSMERMLECYR